MKKETILVLLMLLVLPMTMAIILPPAGTEANPIKIKNCTQLQNISSNLTAYYVLSTAINCTETKDWNNGLGFKPIGTSSEPFVGNIDGKNRQITGLYINRPTEGNIGLFSIADGNAVIKNIVINKAYVSGSASVGTFVGTASNKVLSNLVVKNTDVRAEDSFVGGIIGLLATTLDNSTFQGDITTGDYTIWGGGLVGEAYTGSKILSSNSNVNITSAGMHMGGIVGTTLGTVLIKDCYSVGSINAIGDMAGMNGGIVGSIQGYTTITNVYSTVNLNGGFDSNGFIGYFAGTPGALVISDSFYTGKLVSPNIQFAIGGYNKYMPNVIPTFTNVYWFDYPKDNVTRCVDTINIAGCTMINSTINGGLKFFKGNVSDHEPFLNWDFNSTWKETATGYPVLR